MTKRHAPAATPLRSDLEGALATMSADELRALVRDMLLELDEQVYSRVVSTLLGRAARSGSGWAPAALSSREVSESLAFAKAALRAGDADPDDVDEHLQRATGAFLRKDYAAAFRIFGALLRPIGEGEIDLGQHELVDEVLGTDVAECAGQYVVAAYMTSDPNARAEAVLSALHEVSSLGYIVAPLQDMEHVAVEPLPDLEAFLPRWKALIEEQTGSEPPGDWDSDQRQWLREVVGRLEGAEGLARVARSTRSAADLRAWCHSLVEARDWKAAIEAFDEAAELVADKEHARGELLDGAALAAQELERQDLPVRLERAWRASPSMLRLRRWLGSAGNRGSLRKRAAEALAACPKQAHRQRALLHVILGNLDAAATLLASAPGLGWSGSEHPGHLLFPLFQTLLGGTPASRSSIDDRMLDHGLDIEELGLLNTAGDGPRLAAPGIGQILEQAGVGVAADDTVRAALIESMRTAAERRVAGVTGKQRRGHYAHAASLVAICAAVDPSPATARWVARLRDEYRRFPALRAELDRHSRAR